MIEAEPPQLTLDAQQIYFRQSVCIGAVMRGVFTKDNRAMNKPRLLQLQPLFSILVQKGS
jgi:hypothetical protein